MNRLVDCFAQLRRARRRALVIYLTAGDPDVAGCVAAAIAAVAAGADVLEVGVPFSDPVADGPVIQRAMQRALAGGGGLAQATEVIAALRQRLAVPIVAFGYVNPLLAGGLARTCAALAAAGADGLLVVDVPHEEAAPLRAAAAAAALAWVPLLAPTSGAARAATIAAQAEGFVYLVSMAGVTGGVVAELDGLWPLLAAARAASAAPVCIGFGVRDGASAQRAAALADGVVVGSAVVAAMEAGAADHSGPQRLGGLVRELRAGVDAAAAVGGRAHG